MTKLRVLYIGAGNPIQPSAGMDLVTRAHLFVLGSDASLTVAAVVTSHTAIGKDAASFDLQNGKLQVFSSDFSRSRGRMAQTMQKLRFVMTGRLLCTVGFKATKTRRAISEALARSPQVLVIDHVAAMANISLLWLMWQRVRHRRRVLVISHDITSTSLLDAARFKQAWLKKLLGHLQAAQAHVYEASLFAISNMTVFISDYDRQHFRPLVARRAKSLCPVPAPLIEQRTGPFEALPVKYIVFIGSPSFFPNAHAINWIIDQLAPALLELGSELKILLVGKSTDQLQAKSPPNVEGLGFVSDEALRQILQESQGLLSPIVYGSGLKIKILEAIAAGCPIWATEQSLRGYEFMALAPTLALDRPDLSARAIDEAVSDNDKMAAIRKNVALRWQEYTQLPDNRLSKLVSRV